MARKRLGYPDRSAKARTGVTLLHPAQGVVNYLGYMSDLERAVPRHVREVWGATATRADRRAGHQSEPERYRDRA